MSWLFRPRRRNGEAFVTSVEESQHLSTEQISWTREKNPTYSQESKGILQEPQENSEEWVNIIKTASPAHDPKNDSNRFQINPGHWSLHQDPRYRHDLKESRAKDDSVTNPESALKESQIQITNRKCQNSPK